MPIPLRQNWNFAAYYPEANLPALEAFSCLGENLILAKDEQGRFCRSSIGFSNMGLLSRGKGYQLKIAQADTLVYPNDRQQMMMMSDDDDKNANAYVNVHCVHFRPLEPTGRNMSLLLNLEFRVHNLEYWEMGAFTASGLCVGAARIGGRASLPVRKNSSQVGQAETPVAGLGNGQAETFVSGLGNGQAETSVSGLGNGQAETSVSGLGNGQAETPVSGLGNGQAETPVAGLGNGQAETFVSGLGNGQAETPVLLGCAIWGDDPTTEAVDGAVEGEALYFIAWDGKQEWNMENGRWKMQFQIPNSKFQIHFLLHTPHSSLMKRIVLQRLNWY